MSSDGSNENLCHSREGRNLGCTGLLDILELNLISAPVSEYRGKIRENDHSFAKVPIK